MSRSIKKTPITKQRSSYYKVFAKRQANKKVRKASQINNGKYYRKVYPSYEIYDFASYYSLQERIDSYRNPCSYIHRVFKTEEEAIEDWKRFNYRK